jgi:hypothetical protein
VSQNSANSVVSTPQVLSAGLAATGASFVTSRFGVAGTLLGAALTAMIITGGSAILRAYLETLTGHVRRVPKKLRSRGEQQRSWDAGVTMPGRPDLRDNSVGRMRAALGWFSHLPTLRRRSILMKGLVAAAVAFLICMGLVWGAEKVIGNSLSCGLWAQCPYGAVPGIHPLGYGSEGAGSSLSGGAVNTGNQPSLVDRVRQNHNPFGGDRPALGNPGGAASSASPKPAASPAAGGKEPAPQKAQESASPAAGGQAAPSSAAPSSAAPKARQQAAPSSAAPSSAAPKARQQAAPSSASPAAGQ